MISGVTKTGFSYRPKRQIDSRGIRKVSTYLESPGAAQRQNARQRCKGNMMTQQASSLLKKQKPSASVAKALLPEIW